jgi:hypothetical protein
MAETSLQGAAYPADDAIRQAALAEVNGCLLCGWRA